MADAAISALVSAMLRKLASIAIQEVGLLWRLKKDVLSLEDDLNQIQAVLEDAEEKHTNEKTVELWLKTLKSASLKVENVLDEVLTEAMIRKLEKELGIKSWVRSFFSSYHKKLMFRIRTAHKVKTLRRQLDTIAAKRLVLNLTPSALSVHIGVGGEMPNRETSSLIHSSILYGRNEVMEMVVEKICNKDIGCKYDVVDEIHVYAIWGMGGLGKTTLAQLVYNHERVDEHFELKCWIYVSEKFQVKELIKGIIESIDKSEYRLSQLDEMQKYLQVKLLGKRFLLVLDDVWIEDNEKEKWDELSKTLSCGAKGSIVLITTRSKKTSQMMAKVPDLQHELGCLSEMDSWSLFKKLAFAEGRVGEDVKELEHTGKKIVEKCKGLPLAVKSLGGLMWSKSSTRDWERVMGSEIWELQGNEILPALKLSYDNLLPHLKRCFAYCCLFPKGHEMEKDSLICLWITNGLIPASGEVNLYVLGEEIISCLVWKSFFQLVQDDHSYLGNDRYKTHDLLHDLAQYVMRHNCSVIKPGKELIIPGEVLHLSSSCPNFFFSEQDLKRLTSLRSLYIFSKGYDAAVSPIFDHVYLRALYMVGIRLTTLPESICKLRYLKYLNLSWSWIEVLPESIIYLQHLQLLLLKSCRGLRKMPEGMRYMRSLQHVDLRHCKSLGYFPVGLKELTCLQRLPYFPIGTDNGAQIGELDDLNLLEDELFISGLENVGGLREAKNAKLKCKKNLLVLKLKWKYVPVGIGTRRERIQRDEEVLEGLEPNPSLKELEIFQCMGKMNSLPWMVNLINLVKISFYQCINCEHIPPLGKLPSLKCILLNSMNSLECFHDDDNTTSSDNIMFPALQELGLHNCPNLLFLPSNFPKLKILRLLSCGELRSLPDEIQFFKDLKELMIHDCKHLSRRYKKETCVDWPKISHIPHIDITPKGTSYSNLREKVRHNYTLLDDSVL